MNNLTELKPKILIIDDKIENLIVLEEILDELNVEFIRALSGKEAAIKTIEHDFTLILVDVQMPEMDGFETVELIRKRRKNRDIPVIFISAIYSENYYKIKGLKAGGVDFITKPVIDEILIGKVKIFLELYKKNQCLETAIQKLYKKNKELEDFTYVVSHDLKAPLRKIATFGEFLMEDYADKLDEEGVSFIRKMQNATIKMNELINELLNLSRVSTVEQKFEKLNSNKLILKVLELLQFNKNGNMFIDSEGNEVSLGELPEIFADDTQLRQVFQNLISNSLKYCKPNKIAKIEINATCENECITFSITDNGIGFEQKHNERIFKIFQRLHTNSQYSGTGVGLAICKKIIEQHNGDIWCDSEVDKGSTFYFSLKQSKELL